MKKIIIATAIALAIPAVAIAEEAATVVAPPQALPMGMPGGMQPPFDLHKALHISPQQKPAFIKYLEAEWAVARWERGPLWESNAALNDAVRNLSHCDLPSSTTNSLLRIGSMPDSATPEVISQVTNFYNLNDEQKDLYQKYVEVLSYRASTLTKLEENLFTARKSLVEQLSANQLRTAFVYGLIDARPLRRNDLVQKYGFGAAK